LGVSTLRKCKVNGSRCKKYFSQLICPEPNFFAGRYRLRVRAKMFDELYYGNVLNPCHRSKTNGKTVK